MEPAQIDWKRIDSRFVEDVFYEHIRAPKWFDFLASPNHLDSIDDDAWFCKPDCNHPKRPEDFLPTTPSYKKQQSLRDTSESLAASEQKHRRRGHALSPFTTNNQDGENQNPNLATPSHQAKSWRAALKSTSVKKTNKEAPRLKSTQSARNLFSGRDILGHISEFCYELKRMATRVTEREDAGKFEVKENHMSAINEPCCAHDVELKKERKPLLEVSKDKIRVSTEKGGIIKDNRRRKKRVDDAENIPVPLNLDTVKNRGEERRRKKKVDDDENIIPAPLNLMNVKKKGEDRLLQIRTNPPSPQCFSENRTAALKAWRAKPTERDSVEEAEEKSNRKSGDGKEGRGLDVLWFLKPCTLAT